MNHTLFSSFINLLFKQFLAHNWYILFTFSPQVWLMKVNIFSYATSFLIHLLFSSDNDKPRKVHTFLDIICLITYTYSVTRLDLSKSYDLIIIIACIYSKSWLILHFFAFCLNNLQSKRHHFHYYVVISYIWFTF